MMFVLSDKTKSILEKRTGLSYLHLSSSSLYDDGAAFSKSPIYSKKRKKGIFGRGNPFLSKKYIKTMDDVDAQLEMILCSKE